MNSSIEARGWAPRRPRLRVMRLVATWAVSSVALLLASAFVSGVTIAGFWGAVAVAAAISVLNAFAPPLVAALRLPATLITGFVLMIIVNVLMIEWASSITDHAITVSDFGATVMTALFAAAFSTVISSALGIDDDDQYTFRIVRRIARRHRSSAGDDPPGLVFLEIDGLALPILRRAMQDGDAPTLAGWLSSGSHAPFEWETDLSSQAGASQAGILLGSNADIPAFRWVEKERGTIMTCSSPANCAEIERRHVDGGGLLRDGGASRGNLFSGEADAEILTISRLEAEVHSNPGYRTFLSNAYNVSRSLVLTIWELWLELWSATLQRRRDVRPRGKRGGKYPFVRAAMCVLVRALIVQSVITDMLTGRPTLYATFSAYDEVAHHSGLARPDTMEALRNQHNAGQPSAPDQGAVVLGSGNLGLIYLMDEKRRLTLEAIQTRHPRLIDALRHQPHIGWLLVRSETDGPLVLGRDGTDQLATGHIDGEDPLAAFSPTASSRLLRTDGFEHVADIMVGSFYDPELEEGCAFEELISFHGGLGAHQTRAFVLHRVALSAPESPIVGAEQLHDHLMGWRRQLQHPATTTAHAPQRTPATA